MPQMAGSTSYQFTRKSGPLDHLAIIGISTRALYIACDSAVLSLAAVALRAAIWTACRLPAATAAYPVTVLSRHISQLV